MRMREKQKELHPIAGEYALFVAKLIFCHSCVY